MTCGPSVLWLMVRCGKETGKNKTAAPGSRTDPFDNFLKGTASSFDHESILHSLSPWTAAHTVAKM